MILFLSGIKNYSYSVTEHIRAPKMLNSNSSHIFPAQGHCLFTLANDLLDQFRVLENCPPTPPLSQHFALSEKKVIMLA